MECNEKFKSLDKLIEHINENECGKWLCCRTYLRKHMKKEHKNTNEQDIETEENKKENNVGKEKSETGIMIGDLTNQSNRSEDYDLKNNKTETLQVSKNCGFKYPSKIKHKRIKHVDNQINNKEAKLANTSQKLKWDPGVSSYPLVQLKEVGIKHGSNMLITKSITKKKNQQICASDEKGTRIHNTQENGNTYAEEEANTTSVKEPDITTGSTKNNHDILPYTKD